MDGGDDEKREKAQQTSFVACFFYNDSLNCIHSLDSHLVTNCETSAFRKYAYFFQKIVRKHCHKPLGKTLTASYHV